MALAQVSATWLYASELEEVVVSVLRNPVSPSAVIGNTAVLDQQTLDIVAPTHIQQVLSRVPGVSIQRNSGQEYLPAIRSPAQTGAGACGIITG